MNTLFPNNCAVLQTGNRTAYTKHLKADIVKSTSSVVHSFTLIELLVSATC